MLLSSAVCWGTSAVMRGGTVGGGWVWAVCTGGFDVAGFTGEGFGFRGLGLVAGFAVSVAGVAAVCGSDRLGSGWAGVSVCCGGWACGCVAAISGAGGGAAAFFFFSQPVTKTTSSRAVPTMARSRVM